MSRTDIRPLADDDVPALVPLLVEAFSGTLELEHVNLPGQTRWGTFVDGRLVATANRREYDSWFRGEPIPTCGVAGVAVAAEHRGQGLLRPLLTEVLVQGRSEGDLVSTLFPSAVGIYRGLGYERIGELARVELPTLALGRFLAGGGGRTLRRGDPGDPALTETVRGLYDTWAATLDGPLTRRGASFPDAAPLPAGTWTLAVDDADRATGYARWRRGEAGTSELIVDDLVWTDVPSLHALLGSLGSHASAAETVRLTLSGSDDPLRRHLPTNHARVVGEAEPYMLAVLGASAIAALPAPPGIDAELPFALDGIAYVYAVADGEAEVERDRTTDPGTLRDLTPRGMALTFAGAATSRDLRRDGLLTGPDDDDAWWDALFGARTFAVRDAF